MGSIFFKGSHILDELTWGLLLKVFIHCRIPQSHVCIVIINVVEQMVDSVDCLLLLSIPNIDWAMDRVCLYVSMEVQYRK